VLELCRLQRPAGDRALSVICYRVLAFSAITNSILPPFRVFVESRRDFKRSAFQKPAFVDCVLYSVGIIVRLWL
jgi:hypothetical protein